MPEIHTRQTKQVKETLDHISKETGFSISKITEIAYYNLFDTIRQNESMWIFKYQQILQDRKNKK